MERPGRIKGVGQMRLTVEQITLPDGRSFPLGATLMTAYGAEQREGGGERRAGQRAEFPRPGF